jgi:hypothetical protein
MRKLAVGALVTSMLAALTGIAATGAGAQTTASGPFGGYSTGTVLHADALQAAVAGPRVVDGEVAFSGASALSTGLGTAINNEMNEPVQPVAAGKNAYGRGSGLELGLGTTTPNNPDANQAIAAGLAEATAPPIGPLVTKEGGPIPADPVAYASLLRGQAGAVFDPNTCTIGQPLAYGLGFAADAQLLDAGKANADGSMGQPVVATDTTQNARAVSQSKSFTYLKPNGDGTWGVVSETHQTIAPVTLFKGTANEVTIEALGEWVLRASTTGKAGGAKIEYAPGGSPTPTTPVLRIIQPNAQTPTTTILTLQQLLSDTGVQIPANPLVDISIGEKPRKIAAPGAVPDPKAAPVTSADGTNAAAAVDVVRVNLLQPDVTGGFHALELRIGHMEAKSLTPAGGITCHIPVSKTANPNPVSAGQDFVWTINIPSSPEAFAAIACDLVDISAIDNVTVESGSPKWQITGASNGGTVTGNNKVTWTNLGNYKLGSPPLAVTINGHVPPTSGAGVIRNTVDVTATLGNCTGGAAGNDIVGQIATITGTGTTATNKVGQPITGAGAVSGPKVDTVLAATELPKTGPGRPYAALGLAFLALAAVLTAQRRRLLGGGRA